MRYLLLVCVDESIELSDEEAAGVGPATDAWCDETTARGIRVLGQRLRSVADATCVRLRSDELLVSDGPFAETKEQIGGFDILECADLDQAIEVAAKHPMASFGTIELRPFYDQ